MVNMARTTIDIDTSILRELKRLQKTQRKSLGALVSELLAQALANTEVPAGKRPFSWNSQDMGVPKVDLLDKDALWKVLDEDGPR